MENKIQELTEKIFNEGVERGKNEATRLIEEAQKKINEINPFFFAVITVDRE